MARNLVAEGLISQDDLIAPATPSGEGRNLFDAGILDKIAPELPELPVTILAPDFQGVKLGGKETATPAGKSGRPAMSFNPPGVIRIQSLLSLARGNPLAAAGIVRQQIPGADVSFNEDGDPVVTIPEELGFRAFNADGDVEAVAGEYTLNRKGPSKADVPRVAREVGSGVVAGMLGAGAGASLVARGLGVGTAEGATSLAMDSAAQQEGSQEPLDGQRAALLAGLGFAGEAAASVANLFFSRMFTNARFFRNGQVTPEGERLLRRANIDPEDITDDFARAYTERAQAAIAPEVEAAQAAQGLSQARDLPVPVPMSQGDLTRNVTQQASEDAMLKGARGEGAERVMTGFRRSQQEALQANVPAIQRQLGAEALPQGQGAGVVADALRTGREALRNEVKAAYLAARQTNATMPREYAANLRRDFARMASEGDFRLQDMPQTVKLLKEFRDATKAKVGDVVTLRRLEKWRAGVAGRVTKLENARGPAGKALPEEALLIRLKDAYDGHLQGAIDNAILSGDDAALAAWREAKESASRFATLYNSDKTVAKLARGDATASQAANMILGVGNLGAKQEAVQTVRAIKRIVGDDTPEFAALKGEAFLRIVEAGIKRGTPEAPVGGTAMKRAWDDLRRRNPELLGELFSRSEQALLQRYVDVAFRATDRARGAVNNSNSAIELARTVLEGGGNTTFSRFLLNRLTSAFREGASEMSARMATEGAAIPSVPLFRGGIVGGAAAGVGSATDITTKDLQDTAASAVRMVN